MMAIRIREDLSLFWWTAACLFGRGLVLSFFAGCCQPMFRVVSVSPAGMVNSCCSRSDTAETVCDQQVVGSCVAPNGFASHDFIGPGQRIQEMLMVTNARVNHACRESHFGKWLATKHAEKNAPPWPRFHPVPTNPVFFPEEQEQVFSSEELGIEGVYEADGALSHQPSQTYTPPTVTKNYGQFGAEIP